MTQQPEEARWQDYRQACGHLLNWSEEMTEWHHAATQSGEMHSIGFANRDKWFWVPARLACEMTDFLNAQEARIRELEAALQEMLDQYAGDYPEAGWRKRLHDSVRDVLTQQEQQES